MASKSGETGMPVIIALVVFILLTLGLGIFAYTLNDNLKAAQAKASEAENGKTAAEKNAAKAKEEALMYKAVLGTITDAERQQITSGLTAKDDFRKNHTDMMTSLNNARQAAITGEISKFPPGQGAPNFGGETFFAWDWPATQESPTVPRESLLSAAIKAVAQRELANRRVDTETKSLTQAKSTLEASVTAFNKATAELNKLNAEYPADVQRKVTEASDKYNLYTKNFEQLSNEYRKEKQDLNNNIEDKTATIKRNESDIGRYKDVVSRLIDADADKADPFQFDKPLGKILRRYSDNLVDIDIGSASNLRPGLTFSIYPSDTPTVGMQARMRTVRDAEGKFITRPVPKGTIEVVDILGGDLAQCRVTTEDSPTRDRIITGDLLYNAFWKKGASEHIVLIGIFDLDGDGRDDMQTLVRDLTKAGVSVDAYYDFAAMKWVGEVGTQVTFAIEGYGPSISVADANATGKTAINGAILQQTKQLRDKGIRVLRPRDFFPRIGYPARLDLNQDAINSAAGYFLRLGGVQDAAAAPSAGEQPMAEKKN
jgi:hypothetical protein